jgi:chromosome segregation ATPase
MARGLQDKKGCSRKIWTPSAAVTVDEKRSAETLGYYPGQLNEVELDKAALKAQLEELTKEHEVAGRRVQDATAQITQLEEALSAEQTQVSPGKPEGSQSKNPS